jgi:hypothetical protein
MEMTEEADVRASLSSRRIKENPMTGNRCRRMTRLALLVIPVLALLLALPGASYAQRFTAELSGVVADESGGVIPGADVTLTSASSGTLRRTVTNADGFFAFAAVPAGAYDVAVSIAGFSSYEVKGIQLNAGDSRALREIKLKVATMAETVSVEAEVALTPLNTGEKSATLTSETIENIPIVSSSAAELLRILPGMTPLTQGVSNRPNFSGEVIGINGNGEYQGGGGANQSAIGNFSANGTRTISLDITVDGAPGADPGCNCATSVNPNTEMVQEFKVLASSFSAEYAKGPNAMSVVSKSGGRDFHGSAFLYFRDYHLNSNEWYGNKIGAPRAQNKFVYPGFTFSGPLAFGGFNKNRDKVFFFLGYEYYKQNLDTGFVKSWVPTTAMRNGDFTNAASIATGSLGGWVNTIPTINGVPTPVIPANMIDPGGKALVGQLPMPNADPNVTGGWNYVDNLVVSQPNHQFLARLDYNVSDNTKMFVRYNLQRETQPWVIGLWWRNGQRQVPYPSQITGDNRSDSITASLTHVFDPTLTSETILAFTYIDFANKIADPQAISRQAIGYPYQGVFGQSNDQTPAVDYGGWGDNGPLMLNPGGFDPVLFATKWQWAFTENLTKVFGTHTAKAGFFWEYIKNAQPGNGYSNGRINQFTWQSNSSGNTFADMLLGRVGEYEEQTQNALRSISWNRFELFAQDSWKLSPAFTLNLGVRGSIFQPWTDTEGNGLAVWDASRYAGDYASGVQFPGVYWNARDGSYPVQGVDGNFFFVQPRIGFAWDARGNGETVVRGGGGMYLYHDAQQPYADLIDIGAGVKRYTTCCDGTTLTALEGLGSGAVVFSGSTLDSTDKTQARTYNWSLTVNQKLPYSMNIEIGYVGNKSDKLMNNGIANINAVPLGAMLNDPQGNNDAYRPLAGYGDLQVYRHSAFQNYHGIQAMLARQRGAFNFTLAYTFSKALGLRGDAQGPAVGSEYILSPYRDYNYGVLSYDRTHVATGSFSYLLPEPKSDGAMKQILGGWQFAGILSYVSGAPLPYSATGTNFNITGTNSDGTTVDSRLYSGSPQIPLQPVLTCDPTSSVPSGYLINPACFALPAVGTNGQYNMPYMKAQSYFNTDLSLFKNFTLGGERKLQLRINAYNVFNHPIAYPDPGTNLTLRFTNGEMSDPNFGKLPQDNKFGRRIVQLAVRFTF